MKTDDSCPERLLVILVTLQLIKHTLFNIINRMEGPSDIQDMSQRQDWIIVLWSIGTISLTETLGRIHIHRDWPPVRE